MKTCNDCRFRGQMEMWGRPWLYDRYGTKYIGSFEFGGYVHPNKDQAACDLKIFHERYNGEPSYKCECHRFPKPELKNQTDYCGEFQDADK